MGSAVGWSSDGELVRHAKRFPTASKPNPHDRAKLMQRRIIGRLIGSRRINWNLRFCTPPVEIAMVQVAKKDSQTTEVSFESTPAIVVAKSKEKEKE